MSVKLPLNKTKIVATIGPASQSLSVIEQLIQAGMNIARLNFSHGDFAHHQSTIENIRVASKNTGRRVAIMADLPGPKMRLGKFGVDSIDLVAGQAFTLTARDVSGTEKIVSVSFKRLPQVVVPGDLLHLNDGYVQMEVDRVVGDDVQCTVVVGGRLRSAKGLNLPGIDLGVSAFTDHDQVCLEFALSHGVDAISQSFVESEDDIIAVRKAAHELGHDPFVIAKIERSRALENIEGILDVADGIMVARGDLGVEVPIESMAVIQKDLVRRAVSKGKPVITATQMLESMITNRLPTRAEATDVSNAILDGTDCVMLSGESAVGDYPVESVSLLARIAATVEPVRREFSAIDRLPDADPGIALSPKHLISHSVRYCLRHMSPAAVFTPTMSGASARRVAAFRPSVWVVAVSPNERTCQHLQFSYGVVAIHNPVDPETWDDFVKSWLAEHGLSGNHAMLVAGPSLKNPDSNHRLEIIELG